MTTSVQNCRQKYHETRCPLRTEIDVAAEVYIEGGFIDGSRRGGIAEAVVGVVHVVEVGD